MAGSIRTAQLIDQVAQRTGITQAQAKQAITVVLDVIRDQLAAGDRVQLSGFGTLEVRVRAERTGINPRTRERTRIAASRSVGFRPAAALKDRVAGA